MTTIAAALGGALLLAQFTGNPDSSSEFRLQRIATRHEYIGLPGASLGLPPGQAPFDPPDDCGVPARVVQSLTWQRCLSSAKDQGLVATFKTPPNTDLTTDGTAIIAWSPTTTGTGTVDLNLVCSATIEGGQWSDPTSAILNVNHNIASDSIDELINTTMGTVPALPDFTGGYTCSFWRDMSEDTYAGHIAIAGVIAYYPINSVGLDDANFGKP